MPNVYKSTPAELLDRFFRQGPNLVEHFRFARDQLDGTQSLFDITAGLGNNDLTDNTLAPVAEQADAFQGVWLEPLERERVEPVMRGAYRRAVELASDGVDLDNPNLNETDLSRLKPIETFWISDVGGEFEMHVSTSPRAITVFVVFPRSRPDNEVGSRTAASETFAFRGGEGDGPVEGEKVSGAETQAE